MKITGVELMIIFDTLSGSQRIADNGNVFTYTTEARKNVMNKIQSIMDEIGIDLSAEIEEEENEG